MVKLILMIIESIMIDLYIFSLY